MRVSSKNGISIHNVPAITAKIEKLVAHYKETNKELVKRAKIEGEENRPDPIDKDEALKCNEKDIRRQAYARRIIEISILSAYTTALTFLFSCLLT